MAYRASGLNLVVNAIILWNTTYLARTIHYVRGQGVALTDERLSHVAPVKWDHIGSGPLKGHGCTVRRARREEHLNSDSVAFSVAGMQALG
jgi:hypothetical protein